MSPRSESVARLQAGDPDLARRVVDDLVATGRSGGADDELRVEDAIGLSGPGLVEALVAREESAEPAVELPRVARLYELLDQSKRAARAWRKAVGSGEGLSLTLGVAFADAAADGAPALALGLLDWLAKALTLRDDRPSDREALDPVRTDPVAMCGLLEQAAEVALRIGRPVRAVALLRTAAARYERMGRTRDAFEAQARGAEALRQAGQRDMALDLAMRLRGKAQELGSPSLEAAALGSVAGLLAGSNDGTDLDRALTCRMEAAKVLTQSGDTQAALEHVRVLARLQARRKSRQVAAQTLEASVGRAEEAGLGEPAARLQLDMADLERQAGNLGRALELAGAARKGLKGPAQADSILLMVRVLALAGCTGKARQALGRVEGGDAARGAEVASARAELSAAEGKLGDALGQQLEARLAWSRVGTPEAEKRAAECWLICAGFALDEGRPEQAKALLARAEGVELESPRDLRAELLRARLAEDPDEREILLDEVSERAGEEGSLEDRVLTAAARADHHARQGDEGLAEEAVASLVGELGRIRRGLPEALREGFPRSPLCRALVRLEEHEALAEVVAPLK